MRTDPAIFAALIAGVFVLVGLAVQTSLAWRVLQQKAGNDTREGHWKRIQWAVDLSLADGERQQRVSSVVLESLAAEPALDPYDYLVVETALETQKAVLDRRVADEEALLAALAADDPLPDPGPDVGDDPSGHGQEHERDR